MSTTSTPSFALCKKVGSKSSFWKLRCPWSSTGVAVYYWKIPDWHIGLGRGLLSHWHRVDYCFLTCRSLQGYTTNGPFNCLLATCYSSA